ncbi:hypothetical protein [Caballeronia sp. J97]|uniref:hypothetical protein n=1 Tax=Caballeronia sp. J97 TaxID=2805429 RepID=UPI002AB15B67|nr:hypothetical protein [Caballeronia sp. J97]
MADFLFLFLFLAALGGCVATRVLSKRQFRAQTMRSIERMRPGFEYAYMAGVIDGQSRSVDLGAFRIRMAAWLETTMLRDELNETALPVPARVASEPADANVQAAPS